MNEGIVKLFHTKQEVDDSMKTKYIEGVHLGGEVTAEVEDAPIEIRFDEEPSCGGPCGSKEMKA